MGIDWLRMRPKRNQDKDKLQSLIAAQAEAFRTLPEWPFAELDDSDSSWELEAMRLRRRPYLDITNALKEMLDFPPYDDATDTPLDDPHLFACWRVYPITYNTIFPRRWRILACRTFLPESLKQHLSIWKRWLAEVASSQHRSLLLDEYLYETTTTMKELYADLRCLAEASVNDECELAAGPNLNAVREQILSFQLPMADAASVERRTKDFSFQMDAVLPDRVPDESINPIDHPLYQTVTQKVADLIGLTRAWDSNVNEDQRLGYYEEFYKTFTQFLDQAHDPWLHDFLKWAETCCSREMGLYVE